MYRDRERVRLNSTSWRLKNMSKKVTDASVMSVTLCSLLIIRRNVKSCVPCGSVQACMYTRKGQKGKRLPLGGAWEGTNISLAYFWRSVCPFSSFFFNFFLFFYPELESHHLSFCFSVLPPISPGSTLHTYLGFHFALVLRIFFLFVFWGMACVQNCLRGVKSEGCGWVL